MEREITKHQLLDIADDLNKIRRNSPGLVALLGIQIQTFFVENDNAICAAQDMMRTLAKEYQVQEPYGVPVFKNAVSDFLQEKVTVIL